jgi:uncharacterized membrane protein YdjX (TVP38/TMEM64 family)
VTSPPALPPQRRLAPRLLLVVVAFGVMLALIARGNLTPEMISGYHATLMEWRNANFPLTAVGFFLLYMILAAAPAPGIAILTLLGGYLFGAVVATMMVTVAATLGATGLFLLTRAGLGDRLFKHWQVGLAEGRLARVVAGLQANEFKTLYLLRLAPIVPFFLANTLPAFLGVRLRNFMFTTFTGILPGTALIALAGGGLGEVIAAGGKPEIGNLAPLLVSIPALLLGIVLAVRVLQRM